MQHILVAQQRQTTKDDIKNTHLICVQNLM
jgi:hypothetical protein